MTLTPTKLFLLAPWLGFFFFFREQLYPKSKCQSMRPLGLNWEGWMVRTLTRLYQITMLLANAPSRKNGRNIYRCDFANRCPLPFRVQASVAEKKKGKKVDEWLTCFVQNQARFFHFD